QEQTYIFKYNVLNSGTGPAIIKYAKLRYGEEVIHDWKDLFARTNIKIDRASNSFINGRVIPAGTTVDPIAIYSRESLDEFVKGPDTKVSIEICYCSIYEQCWIVDR